MSAVGAYTCNTWPARTYLRALFHCSRCHRRLRTHLFPVKPCARTPGGKQSFGTKYKNYPEMAVGDDASVVTCTACRARLVGAEARREHYRSELHRVNLKRKVGGQGPLSAEEFQERLQVMQTEQDVKRKNRETQFCEVCSKKFSSLRAIENHMQSRRHRDAVRAADRMNSAGEMLDVSTVASDEESDVGLELERRIAESEAISPLVCVFDGVEHETIEDNFAYMAKKFGFFLPYAEWLVDPEGLLIYLGQKVGIGYVCICCDRAFSSVAAARRHMLDKQHCKMTTDNELWAEEYAEFYDFGAEDEEDGEWEEVEGDELERSMEDENAEMAVTVPGAPTIADSMDNDGTEEEVAMVVGKKVIGHRSLRTYYKQSGKSEDGRYAVVVNKLLNEYRLLGWKRHDKNAVPLNIRRAEVKRNKRFDLKVGGQNYYTRKATFKQSMAVFNSGYRA